MKQATRPPTFLHMQNPHFNRQFVLHTKSPAWLAEVFAFNSEAEAMQFTGDKMDEGMELGSITWHKGKHYVLIVIQVFETLPPVKTQKEADKLARLPRRMADWYLHAVLKNNHSGRDSKSQSE